ncbi:ROK family transcriptional regulator [Fictibacillus phosphorivorans]|uniref:ROK family transcriptional regulator n=1 Tax=Fictibacillus phosphorivorans TaxID=1221500 RepID=UPI002040A9D1|nr:ROK family transcriptional regulator [Fictibacillus phosphorivorans]MCM3720214.1 ROK family transcriptional regulator [Fictibacillus phosphorivorans]MCM3777899.1 ROK family transcriptional regulator [Fictibacillus phosphorivorans]
MSFIGQNTLRTKQLNRSLVLQSILRLEKPTRQEIAAFTKLTPATITNIITELIAEKLVVETGSMEGGEKRAGRKTIALDLNEESKRIAGVHIRSDRVEFGIMTLKGKVLQFHSFPLPEQMDQNDFLSLLIKELEQFLATSSNPVSCIGIGSVGLVDFEQGRILEAEHMGWEDVELASAVSSRFHLPVYVDHHVRGMALAEKLFGSCKNESDFLVVYLGQGIGSGMYLKDQLYRSDLTGAGELGHMIYQPEGNPCWCGSRGCLERYASEAALIKKYQLNSIDDFITGCKRNDEKMLQGAKDAGKKIATVLTSFINMLHVNKIMVGGRLADSELPLITALKKQIRELSFLDKKRHVEIEASSMGEQVGVIGAASLALLYAVFNANLNENR